MGYVFTRLVSNHLKHSAKRKNSKPQSLKTYRPRREQGNQDEDDREKQVAFPKGSGARHDPSAGSAYRPAGGNRPAARGTGKGIRRCGAGPGGDAFFQGFVDVVVSLAVRIRTTCP